MMDELSSSKYENPSECISAWIKEIETYGFHSLAFESNTIDTINNENTKSENAGGTTSNAHLINVKINNLMIFFLMT